MRCCESFSLFLRIFARVSQVSPTRNPLVSPPESILYRSRSMRRRLGWCFRRCSWGWGACGISRRYRSGFCRVLWWRISHASRSSRRYGKTKRSHGYSPTKISERFLSLLYRTPFFIKPISRPFVSRSSLSVYLPLARSSDEILAFRA